MRTPPRPLLRDLDSLRSPAWDLADIGRYREIWQRHHGHFSLNVATSRGCPYHCNWCAKPIWGQRYHVRSPDNVVAELDALQAAYRPDHIWFADDILGLKPGWLLALRGADRGARRRHPLKRLSRADLLLRDGDVDAPAGRAAERWLGAESGRKSSTPWRRAPAWSRFARRPGCASGRHRGRLLPAVRLSGRRGRTSARPSSLVREARPDDIGVSVSYPLPGTKFYRAVQAELGTKRNRHSADLAMMFGAVHDRLLPEAAHGLHREFTAGRPRAAAGRAGRGAYAGGAGTRGDCAPHAAALPVERARLSGWPGAARGHGARHADPHPRPGVPSERATGLMRRTVVL